MRPRLNDAEILTILGASPDPMTRRELSAALGRADVKDDCLLLQRLQPMITQGAVLMRLDRHEVTIGGEGIHAGRTAIARTALYTIGDPGAYEAPKRRRTGRVRDDGKKGRQREVSNEAILAVLESCPEPLTLREISRMLGRGHMYHDHAADRRLFELSHTGRIEVYAAPVRHMKSRGVSERNRVKVYALPGKAIDVCKVFRESDEPAQVVSQDIKGPANRAAWSYPTPQDEPPKHTKRIKAMAALVAKNKPIPSRREKPPRLSEIYGEVEQEIRQRRAKMGATG